MNSLSLYNITNGFVELMNSEEITEADKVKIEAELLELLEHKSSNIIGFTKNIELTIEAMKSEEKRIADNRKTLENKLSKFKEYVKDCMINANIPKVETELGTISIAKNPISCEIVNEEIIPNKFKTEVITTKIDKKAILDNFKETGELIDGVVINTDKKSIRIK
jgi:cysteine sulfinate desulfinase/cysteine desulfurase-like protein